MTKEELLEIFEWLEENMGLDGLLYFKFLDVNVIGAYFNADNQHFANFYINAILKSMRGGKSE